MNLRRTASRLRNLLLDSYYWSRSRREFLDRLNGLTTLDDAVRLIYAYRGRGLYHRMKPNQDDQEIKKLCERVQAIAPKVIIEIGTRLGGTLFLWSQCAPSVELVVSIDLPEGIHGGGYPPQRIKFYQLFVSNRPGCQLELLRLDSQTESTKARLLEILNGRPIDFLFIDGDHRYLGVKKDFELYAGLVRRGGLIAFHDIRPNNIDKTIQVFQLWDEIKAQSPQVEEIIHEPYAGRYGIGILTQDQ